MKYFLHNNCTLQTPEPLDEAMAIMLTDSLEIDGWADYLYYVKRNMTPKLIETEGTERRYWHRKYIPKGEWADCLIAQGEGRQNANPFHVDGE
jgi:hypothetical protein